MNAPRSAIMLVLAVFAGCGTESPAAPRLEPPPPAPPPPSSEAQATEAPPTQAPEPETANVPEPAAGAEPAGQAEPAAQGEPVAQAEPAVEPVQAAEPSDELEDEEEEEEDDLPRLDPSLANAERVGPSAFFEDVGTAIGAGWVDFENGDLQVIAEIAYQRRGYALVAAPGRPTGRRDGVETYDLWLARTESRPDPDDPAVTTHRRVAAARLYAGVVASESMMDNQYDCVVESELRARDLDGDGEVEITVLASYYRPVEELETECGTAAFLVGGDDLATQARFSREYHYYSTGAGGDTGEVRDTAWQVRDLDGDSHADLQVTETWRYRDDFAGDDIGDGETAPAERSRRADRRVLVCPWIAGEDVWRCPVTPEPGQAIFADRASRGAGRGVRPWQ